MTSDYSAIIENLYITNWESSNNPELLTKHNIKAIISVEKSTKPDYFLQYINKFNVDFKQIFIDDDPSVDISKFFDETFDFINKHISKNENVLVHCMAGISRSVTIVINYLIRKMIESVAQIDIEPIEIVARAFYLVKQNRPVANPNQGFILQLIEATKKYQKVKQNTYLNNSNDNINMTEQHNEFMTEDQKSGNVIYLDDNDFDQNGNLVNFPQTNGVILFYAPWCGHCKTLKPHYAKFSLTLPNNVRAFAVNSDNNKTLMNRIKDESFGYNIKGYPTIVAYNNGKYFSTYGMEQGSQNPFRSSGDLLEYANGIGSAEVIYE